MFCYRCGVLLSEHDFCTGCGADVALYKKILAVSNMYYNEGLEKATVRDLTGAVASLRQSLKFNKNNIEARNLLGLVYFEMGEVVAALSEWVISKNLKPEKNIADDFIEKMQSNPSRLDAINSTIKKYNQALTYCQQDNKDMAVIQLKKVLSINPKFVRAHMLLALLYMDSEQWEKAQRELRKCSDIDRNNAQVLRYMKEVDLMLVPDENTKGGKNAGKKKTEEAVRYISDNEMIIQPVNVKEPKSTGVSTLLNLAIGIAIGLAATFFLFVPAARSEEQQKAQKTITEISAQADEKTVRIQKLETENSKLTEKSAELEKQLEGYVGQSGNMAAFDGLLGAAAAYLQSGDKLSCADALENIATTMDIGETSESFQALYQTLFNAVAPELYEQFYNEGHDAYGSDDYATAITALNRAIKFSTTGVDAYYFLARAYHKNGDTEQAIDVYSKVVEMFPESDRVADARKFLSALGVTE